MKRQTPVDDGSNPKSESAVAASTEEEETNDKLAHDASEEIFTMFSGILHRIVDRIEAGLTDGIADECASVKREDVKDVILSALRQSPDLKNRTGVSVAPKAKSVLAPPSKGEGT